MGSAQELVWEWGSWRAYAVPLNPLSGSIQNAHLVLFDDVTPGATHKPRDLLSADPLLSVLVAEARRSTQEGARLLPAPRNAWAGLVYVPVLHGEPYPLAPVRSVLCRPSMQLVVPASDALRLDVAPRTLAAWLRGGLDSGEGLVVLAANSERDLSKVLSWAGRAARSPRPPRPQGEAAARAKVLGVGALAAFGLAGAAWVERKIAGARARDTSGLTSFEPPGADAVSGLAALLLEELAPRPRESLVRKARGRRGRGQPLAVVEEWIHAVDDPSRELAGLFAPFELAVIARKRFSLDLHDMDDGREMATRILSELGFGRQLAQLGLAGAISQVGLLQDRLSAGGMDPREAAALGPTLEQVAKCLLGFHLRLAFRSDRSLDSLYKTHLAPLATNGQAKAPSCRSLGELAHALDEFHRWRTEGPERRARERHADIYAGRVMDRATLSELARMRNALAHHREEGEQPAQIAPRFLSAAAEWLSHLRDEREGARLFPALVSIEKVEATHTGLLGHGRDDEGREETIRTQQPLLVGSTWYMLPRSNPVRVRPVLVRAG